MKRQVVIACVVLFLSIIVGGGLSLYRARQAHAPIQNLGSSQNATSSGELAPVLPTPTPSPTPRPLTFAERNALYGPCVVLPTLMYHHIQDMEIAKAQGHGGFTVAPDMFRSQMQYLRDKGYTVVNVQTLNAFFDQDVSSPKKSVMLTFDDGYDDFYSDAYPILKEFGYPATLFVPTGLMENPGYTTWGHIAEMAGSGIYMGNHTWSHRSVLSSPDVDRKEISTADTQLAEHGLNTVKVFAYPYGPANAFAEQYLGSLGYTLAFTTTHGSTMCKKQRLDLPRIRIGNTQLNGYGL